VDYIEKFLEQKPFSTKKAYRHYEKEMERVSAERLHEAKSAITSLKAHKSKLEDRILRTKDFLLNEKDEEIKGSYKNDIKKANKDISDIQSQIVVLEKKIKAGKEVILTYSEFIELMEGASKILANIKSIKPLNTFIKKMFLNFSIKDKKVVDKTLNTPFDVLYDKDLSNGGDGGS
jgi:predicted RNase H-like nuclease (RuvC/YqgF family)